jgi:hypothetical protein
MFLLVMQSLSIRTAVEQVSELSRLISKNRAQILSLCAAVQQSQSLLKGFNGKIPSTARRKIRLLGERAQRLREDSLRLVEQSREVTSTIRRSK